MCWVGEQQLGTTVGFTLHFDSHLSVLQAFQIHQVAKDLACMFDVQSIQMSLLRLLLLF